jgi:hypothetical protein
VCTTSLKNSETIYRIYISSHSIMVSLIALIECLLYTLHGFVFVCVCFCLIAGTCFIIGLWAIQEARK